MMRQAFLAVMAVVVSMSWAQAADHWRVHSVSGVVMSTNDKQLSAGDIIFAGEWITTAEGASATIKRAGQTISLGANARIVIEDRPAASQTKIRQSAGVAQYHVNHRFQPHFEVRTRQIAAVVKGTVFTVSAEGESHFVDVTEGLVDVRALNASASAREVRREARTLVAAGQRAVAIDGGAKVRNFLADEESYGAPDREGNTQRKPGGAAGVQDAALDKGDVSPAFRRENDYSDGLTHDGLEATAEDALDVKDEIEDDVGVEVNEELGNEISSAVNDEIADEVDDQVSDELDDEIVRAVNDELNDEVEIAINDDVEDEVDDDITTAIADEVDDEVDDDITAAVADEVDDEVQDAVDSDIESEADDDVAEEIENEVGDQIDGAVDDDVESEIDEDVDEVIEDDVADEVGDLIDDEIDDGIDGDVVDDIGEELENALD